MVNLNNLELTINDDKVLVPKKKSKAGRKPKKLEDRLTKTFAFCTTEKDSKKIEEWCYPEDFSTAIKRLLRDQKII